MPRKKKPARERPGEYVGFRAPTALKAKLEKAALAANRSLSSEAQFRLERSFERGSLIREVLAAGYGAPLAGALLLAGRAMLEAGYIAHAQECADKMVLGPVQTGWLNSPYAYEQAVRAALTILESMRPEGTAQVPTFLFDHRPVDELNAEERESYTFLVEHPEMLPGHTVAMRLLRDVESGEATSVNADELKGYIDDLGPLQKRLSGRIPPARKPSSYAERLAGLAHERKGKRP